ncbi:TetR/AcrR family transcriptional regulator [Tepidanaerobacter sp. GT38]|uniref:TetR/AcrR family transcriptional regulator n=1 Tax=Tepidanaerobacter sp. GT38 TaxID=2722793 RepID=UPI001F186CE8|nr:TetR/AcrR family transcriptional regulator [Tepidanaerobacter sp. GT38]
MVKIKKELLRQAAIDVIAENGFHDATIEKIAAKAKVAVGTVYNYFENKESILDYIFQVEYEKRVEFLSELSKENKDPLDKIREIMAFHFSELKQNPNLAKVILKERSFNKQDKMSNIRNFEQLPIYISKIIQDGIDKSLIRKCNAEILSVVLFGSIEAILTKFIIENEQSDKSDSLDIAADEIWKLLKFGLTPSQT